MTVYAHVDTLPQPVNQGEVVKFFATRPEGALVFTQSTLSRKLQHRSEIEVRMTSVPNALSSKRLRIVTRPDVDRALWLWVQHMEQKREVVNVGCSLQSGQCSRRNLMFQKMKGFVNLGGFNRSVARE